MALSAPPPRLDPPASSSTTAATSSATATTTTTRPNFQNPPTPANHLPFYSPPSRLTSNPNPNYAQLSPRPPHLHSQNPSQLLYPVASSGRGFLHRPVTMSTSRSVPRQPFVIPYPEMGFIRPSYFLPSVEGCAPTICAGSKGGGIVPGVVKGIPVSASHQLKLGPPPVMMPERNGHTESRDVNKSDSLVVVRHRKVRISDSTSLYALCRSWLRNGFPEDDQPPQNPDDVKTLPRPLPMADQIIDSPDKIEGHKGEEDENEESVEHMTAMELLQMHVKRGKRVRSRLREERLRRITRYKARLALLLPPMVEQHLKNDNCASS